MHVSSVATKYTIRCLKESKTRLPDITRLAVVALGVGVLAIVCIHRWRFLSDPLSDQHTFQKLLPDEVQKAIKGGRFQNNHYEWVTGEQKSGLKISELRSDQVRQLFDKAKTEDQRAFEGLPTKEVQKAIANELLQHYHYEWLTGEQKSGLEISKLRPDQVCKLFVENATNQRVFARLSPEKVQRAISNGVLADYHYGWITKEQKKVIEISKLSVDVFSKLFKVAPGTLRLMPIGEIQKVIALGFLNDSHYRALDIEVVEKLDLSQLPADKIVRLLDLIVEKLIFQRIAPTSFRDLHRNNKLSPRHYQWMSDEQRSAIGIMSRVQFQALCQDEFQGLSSKAIRVFLLAGDFEKRHYRWLRCSQMSCVYKNIEILSDSVLGQFFLEAQPRIRREIVNRHICHITEKFCKGVLDDSVLEYIANASTLDQLSFMKYKEGYIRPGPKCLFTSKEVERLFPPDSPKQNQTLFDRLSGEQQKTVKQILGNANLDCRLTPIEESYTLETVIKVLNSDSDKETFPDLTIWDESKVLIQRVRNLLGKHHPDKIHQKDGENEQSFETRQQESGAMTVKLTKAKEFLDSYFKN